MPRERHEDKDPVEPVSTHDLAALTAEIAAFQGRDFADFPFPVGLPSICKCLWKSMFPRHRLPKAENGIVDAMDSGKVSLPPHRAKAKLIQRGR